MLTKKRNIVLEKAFEFSLQVIELYKIMVNGKEFVISKQLLRAGTSIGANISEAQAGQSKKDFIAKMCIASKEARETQYWLLLLQRSGLCASAADHIPPLLSDVDDLINIITRIIKTAEAK